MKPPSDVLLRTVIAESALGVLLGVTGRALNTMVGTWESEPRTAAEVLTLIAGSLTLLLAAWLAVGIAVTALATATSGRSGARVRRMAQRLTPGVLGQLTALVLGVGLTVSCVPPGANSPTAPAERVSVVALDPRFLPNAAAPDPGWVPTPPTVRPQPDPTVLLGPGAASRPAPRETRHVVTRGESLWSIAAAHLPSSASDREIAHAWPQWYAVNRDVIGPDPDLILPGQVLRAPEAVRQ